MYYGCAGELAREAKKWGMGAKITVQYACKCGLYDN